MKIYVITHKKFNDELIQNNNLYQPLLVGVANGNKGGKKYLRDNINQNISAKNQSFCELTGIYWVWKNCNDDIVGFDHYRRYLVNNKGELLSKLEIDRVLNYYDAILPIKDSNAFLGKTASQYFGDRHDPLIWTICRDVIKNKYPAYVADFDWYSYQYEGYSYNMIVAHKNLIDRYNDWLFNILFELDKEIDLSNYTDYNKRMWGFLSERLINVWLHHNKVKIKEYPVKFIGKKKRLRQLVRKYVGKYWRNNHPIYRYKEK